MTDATKVERLLAARNHLEQVMDSLDVSEETCGDCGTRTYKHFGDHLLARKLSGMIKKIDNEVGKLRTGHVRGRGDFHGGHL